MRLIGGRSSGVQEFRSCRSCRSWQLLPILQLLFRGPEGQDSLAPGLYVFSAMSQSCSSSSFVLVRFSGDPSEPSAACFLRSSLFHPGKPASIPQPRTRTIGPLNTYSGLPLIKASAGRMYLVPEGQHDRSQARSAWSHEKNCLRPSGTIELISA
jgi:hypothetical protein